MESYYVRPILIGREKKKDEKHILVSVLLTFGQSKRLCVNQSRATGQQRAIRPRRCSIFLCFRERDFERKELKKREFGSLIYQKGSGEEEEKKDYWMSDRFNQC